MHGEHLPPRLFNSLLGGLLPTTAAGGPSGPPPQQPLCILLGGDAGLGVATDFLGRGELADTGVKVAEDGLGVGVYGVAVGGGEVGCRRRSFRRVAAVVGKTGGVRGTAGWGGGGEVRLADGEKIGLEGEDVGVLMVKGLVRVRREHWEQFFSCSRKRGKEKGGGEGYYSVGFLEELIAGGGAGERVPVRVGIVSFEELVERGGDVSHLR